MSALRHHQRYLRHNRVVGCAMQQAHVRRSPQVCDVQIGAGSRDRIGLDQAYPIENPLNQIPLTLRPRATGKQQERAV